MPKVSVCIPVYNVECYIKRCLESILKQSIEDIEVIVVNDCTPDNSIDIVRKYAEQDKRIKIIEHNTNHGLMFARRTGYMAASGDYITFCDSDDSLVPGSLELLYSTASSTLADIVAGQFQVIYNDGRVLSQAIKLEYGKDAYGLAKSLLRNQIGHNLCGKLFKRELLQDYSYQTFDNLINGEDGCLLYQLLPNMHRIETVCSPVYNYYQNSDSSTHAKLSKRGIDNILITNTIRVRICRLFPDLYTDLFHVESIVLINLFANGYNSDGFLRKGIQKYGLEEYINPHSILKHYNFLFALKLLGKLYIKPLFLAR